MKKIVSIILFCTLFSSAFLFGEDSENGSSNRYGSDFVKENQRTLLVVGSDFQYNLNPHTASYANESQILSGLYEGLFSYDPVTLQPLNALCTSYKVSRDKKRWTFTLRSGAKFSDGKSITAQSIKDSWVKLLSTPNATFVSLIDCITGATEFRNGKISVDDLGISVRDNQTLVVHLNSPTSALPNILCHHAFAAVGGDNVFSGAFCLKSVDEKQIVLEKNENYWDAESVALPEIKFIRSDDPTENAVNFNTGEVDWVSSVVAADAIIDEKCVSVSPIFGTCYLFFKIKNRPWNFADFRRALLEAIPYDKIRKNYGIPADTFVYPLNGYPEVPGYDDYDVDDGIALMKAARKKMGIAEDLDLPLVFASDGSSEMKRIAEILKKAWKPLGVSLIVQTTSPYQYNSAIDNWNADLFIYSWIGDYADPTAFLELFRGNSSLNKSGYAGREYDRLLNQAALTNDAYERYEILSSAEDKLLTDAMIIPLYHQLGFNVIDVNSIGGWINNALNLHPLKYLYIKQKKIKIPNMI